MPQSGATDDAQAVARGSGGAGAGGRAGGTSAFQDGERLAQGAAQQTTDINHQISSMNSRISQYQQTLQAQFSAMEASLATLQQQAGSLGLQLSNSNSSSGRSSS